MEREALLQEAEGKAVHLLQEVERFSGTPADSAASLLHPAPSAGLAQGMRQELAALLQMPRLARRAPWSKSVEFKAVAAYLTAGLGADPFNWGSLLGWWCVHALGRVAGEARFADQSRSWIDEWLLGKVLAGALQDLGLDEGKAWQAVGLVKLLTTHQRALVFHPAPSPAPAVPAAPRLRAYRVLDGLLKDDEVQQFLRVNRYGDVLWFNKEAFDELLRWLLLVDTVQTVAAQPAEAALTGVLAAYEVVRQLRQAEEQSGYQVEELVRLLQSNPA